MQVIVSNGPLGCGYAAGELVVLEIQDWQADRIVQFGRDRAFQSVEYES